MRRALLALPALGLALAACGGGDRAEGPPPAAPDRIELTSPAFEDGGRIPVKYSCDGDEVSPPLAWSGVPGGARELALLVEDPDAPGGTFAHWVLFKLRPGRDGIAEGEVPAGARQAENSKGDAGYAGPCPPKGDDPHHYEFTLYALSSPIDLPDGAPAGDVRAAVSDGALARGRLVGRFGR
jgi:Raf kinase inhibitor-like YbhB/YbcL family protein